MATLKIDLGLKSFEVCDTDGNTLGTIRFNPSDPGLLPRWKLSLIHISGRYTAAAFCTCAGLGP